MTSVDADGSPELRHNDDTDGRPSCAPVRKALGGKMASRFLKSCEPGAQFCTNALSRRGTGTAVVCALMLLVCQSRSSGQMLLKPPRPGEQLRLMPSDIAIMEAPEERKEIPCTVTDRKPVLGFDLHFHSGYDVTVPLSELAGSGELLTIVFRVYPENDRAHPAYFVQHFRVPDIQQDAKGDAVLPGSIDIGEGDYHVDWLMRDRSERICSSRWDIEAALSPKEEPMKLFIAPNQIAETSEPFAKDSSGRPIHRSADSLDVKLLVNFAPQNALSAALRRSDTDALVSILKAIEHDPRIGRMSLVAFNIEQSRVIYRQQTAQQIDFPALGKALESMNLGTVNVAQLGQKHSETDFLQNLIEREVSSTDHPDAIIFAGPKAMLDANVPADDLRRIGDIECPVFYMNYNLNPQAVPWKDSISHAIRAFKGTEYTISRPRDLWVSTAEMVNRIARFKREKTLNTASALPSE